MEMKAFLVWPSLWLILWVTCLTECRYLAQNTSDDGEDDTDLEEALNDYYDSLFEAWTRHFKKKADEMEKNLKVGDEEGEGEGGTKPKREDGMNFENYAYVPDMNADDGLPEGNKTKSILAMSVPKSIGNVTFNFLNEVQAQELQKALREREIDPDNWTRSKQSRLSFVRESLLNLRGGNSSFGGMANINPEHVKALEETYERHWKNDHESEYSEKYQSFFPSCETPKNTDEELWADHKSMNLFFDVFFPTPQTGTTLMIVDAVLMLYPISKGNSTSGNSMAPGMRIQMDQSRVIIPSLGYFNSDDDKKVCVSVYWYTRSLRRTKSKKKLLDIKMIPVNGVGSIKFNIRAAVRSWKKTGKNFGILVTIEDEDSDQLRVSDYIHQMNCSKLAASIRPLPLLGPDSPTQYFIEDGASSSEGNGSGTEADRDESRFRGQPVKYPILGLHTREISDTDMENLEALKSDNIEIDLTRRNASRMGQARDPGRGKPENAKSRITFFERVPIGLPLPANSSSDESDGYPRSRRTDEEDGPRIRHSRRLGAQPRDVTSPARGDD